jgi:hypothetical protein
MANQERIGMKEGNYYKASFRVRIFSQALDLSGYEMRRRIAERMETINRYYDDRKNNDRIENLEYLIADQIRFKLGDQFYGIEISDYRERSGSLIIAFTLFFGTILQYGSVRESIDYLIDDLNLLLSLDGTFATNVSASVLTQISGHQGQQMVNQIAATPNTDLDIAMRKRLKWLAIVGFTSLVISLFTATAFLTERESSNEIDARLEKKIEEVIKSNEIEELLLRDKIGERHLPQNVVLSITNDTVSVK